MDIHGQCHCGNIRYSLEWPGDGADLAIRNCTCSFCVKHGGAWTSNPAAKLAVRVEDASKLTKYRFGTGTADFLVCCGCGVVPLVTSEIDGALYAVVNVNTFEGIDPAKLPRAPTSFDGEGTGERLGRRKRNWIASVTVTGAS